MVICGIRQAAQEGDQAEVFTFQPKIHSGPDATPSSADLADARKKRLATVFRKKINTYCELKSTEATSQDPAPGGAAWFEFKKKCLDAYNVAEMVDKNVRLADCYGLENAICIGQDPLRMENGEIARLAKVLKARRLIP